MSLLSLLRPRRPDPTPAADPPVPLHACTGCPHLTTGRMCRHPSTIAREGFPVYAGSSAVPRPRWCPGDDEVEIEIIAVGHAPDVSGVSTGPP